MAKSKAKANNVRGWLLFFVIIFLLSGIGEVSTFFSTLGNSASGTNETMQLIFAPLIAIELFIAVALIMMQKKVSVPFVYFTLGTMAVAGIVNNLVANETTDNNLKFIGLVTGPVLYFLLALYFKQSDRVKKTLVK